MTKKARAKFSIKSLSDWEIHNYLILIAFFAVFFLRFPSLFEPFLKDQEIFLATYSADLLPKGTQLSILEFPLTVFIKTGFAVLGESLWSIKFFLLIYFLVFLSLTLLLLQRYLGSKKLFLPSLFLVLIYGLPFFGTNQIGWLTYTPLIVLTTITLFHKILKNTSWHEQILLIFPLVAGIVLFFVSNFVQPFSYYQNFAQYAWSKLDQNSGSDEKYFKSFGDYVSQSYSLAPYLKAKTSEKDTIYIAGEQSSIYFLANRKAASGSINWGLSKNLDQTLTEIANNKPKYILYDQKAKQSAELDRLLNKLYNLTAQDDDIKIYVQKSS